MMSCRRHDVSCTRGIEGVRSGVHSTLRMSAYRLGIKRRTSVERALVGQHAPSHGLPWRAMTRD